MDPLELLLVETMPAAAGLPAVGPQDFPVFAAAGEIAAHEPLRLAVPVERDVVLVMALTVVVAPDDHEAVVAGAKDFGNRMVTGGARSGEEDRMEPSALGLRHIRHDQDCGGRVDPERELLTRHESHRVEAAGTDAADAHQVGQHTFRHRLPVEVAGLRLAHVRTRPRPMREEEVEGPLEARVDRGSGRKLVLAQIRHERIGATRIPERSDPDRQQEDETERAHDPSHVLTSGPPDSRLRVGSRASGPGEPDLPPEARYPPRSPDTEDEPTAASDPKPLLSPRQLEVLELMAKGLTNPEIAGVLSISVNTVKTHVAAVIDALDVTNRTEAAVALEQLGLGSHESTAGDGYRVAGFGGRPTIAVLPFEDMSARSEHAYLADGLVEDLITQLSANRWFPVIARNSTFAYKGRSVDVREVSRELGARFVVEGSVQVAGARVRVHVQFIDGVSGEHLYAQRYDREMSDVFALQDELVQDIIGAVEPGITRIDRLSVATKPPADLTSWECLKRGMESLYRGSRDDLLEARALFEQSLELDSQQAVGWSCLSQSHSVALMNGFAENTGDAIEEAIRTAERAIREDPGDALGPATLALARTLARDFDAAARLFERALELNPSQAPSYWGLGTIRLMQGEGAEATRWIERAIRLSPHDPVLSQMEAYLAAAHASLGDMEEALRHARRSAELRPDQPFGPLLVAACAGHLGYTDEAIQARDALARLAPGFGPAQLRVVLTDQLADLFQAGWDRID